MPTPPPTPPPPASSSASLVAEARRYGAERGVNPYVALLEEVRRTAGHVAWLGMKVAEAPSDDALLESHNQWLKLYQQERGHLLKVTETAVRLGLEERIVKVEERKAELMVRAFVASLQELGVPPEFLDAAPAVLRKNLLALEIGGADA
jgi:hypothetical protein